MQREEILSQAVTDFPDTPTLALARKVYKEHPAHFSSVERCGALRYRRGIKVKMPAPLRRKNMAPFRKNGKAGFKLSYLGRAQRDERMLNSLRPHADSLGHPYPLPR